MTPCDAILAQILCPKSKRHKAVTPCDAISGFFLKLIQGPGAVLRRRSPRWVRPPWRGSHRFRTGSAGCGRRLGVAPQPGRGSGFRAPPVASGAEPRTGAAPIPPPAFPARGFRDGCLHVAPRQRRARAGPGARRSVASSYGRRPYARDLLKAPPSERRGGRGGEFAAPRGVRHSTVTRSNAHDFAEML